MSEVLQITDSTQYEQAAAEVFSTDQPAADIDALGTRFVAEFAKAELDRRQTEERWLKDLRQYRGQYDPNVISAIGAHRSKVFVRKTRVKIKTTDSRIADLLFPAGAEKNWTCDTTPVPNMPKEQKAHILNALQAANPGKTLTRKELDEAVLKMAREAAKKMSKVIEDQLTEARYKEVSIKAIHSGHLYGTGVLKGPLVERKVRTRFQKDGNNWEARSEEYVVPFVDYVPIWRFYPDMSASELSQCRYVYERHQMTKAEVVELSRRKSFNRKRIVDYLTAHPQGQITMRYYDNELRIIGDRPSTQGNLNAGVYEILERWGWVDGQDLKDVGVKVPEDRLHETFFANVWLLPNGEIIKAALQPIDGMTWPYYLYYFDKDETSIFGEGLATIMRDDQDMLNAATRMMLDNAAISAGAMLEINVDNLARLEKADEIHPWKVWLRNGANPGTPAVRAIDLPSHLGDLGALADRFDRNADETTAIPRYMTGENPASGAAGTSSGLSMLMGAANIVIKDLVTGWDEGVTRPFLTAMYQWNMKFSRDPSIKGDFDVKARGTASLIAKEVRTRQLNEFAQLTANPMDAPFVKRHKLNILRAEANEMSDVIKTEDEVMHEQQSEQAKLMQAMQMELQASQLAELKGKIAVLSAQAEKARADVELALAKATETKVGTIYSALQAGGVATSQPFVAPAADEILKSSGFKDATPNPSIAQLDGPPVQQQQVNPQGQQQQVAEPANTNPELPAQPEQPEVQEPSVPSPGPESAMKGVHQGIETQRID